MLDDLWRRNNILNITAMQEIMKGKYFYLIKYKFWNYSLYIKNHHE